MMLVAVSLGYLCSLMAIGWLVHSLMTPVFGRGWRLFVAPGVVVHELAHALACIVTGAQIHEINFWKPTGGHVMHTQPRLQILGPVLISFAPVLVMTLGLAVILPAISASLPALAWVQSVPETFRDLTLGYVGSLWQAIVTLNWLSATPWLLIYALLNVAVTITPSATDVHNARWAFVGLIILVLGFGQLVPANGGLAWVWPPVATTLVLLGLAVVVSLIIRFGHAVVFGRQA